MKKEMILEAMNQLLKEVDYVSSIRVRICGEEMHLTETQVRALQVVARNLKYTKYIEFERDVVVYESNCADAKAMEWKRSGRFEDEFRCGLMSANSKLSYKLSE